MLKTIEGNLIATGLKFALVVSRFNDFMTDKLVSGAVDVLRRHGVEEKSLSVVYVPGAFEIPIVAKRLAQSEEYNAVICLGAVVRGETPHFDYISAEVTKGVAQVALESNIPVTLGVLTCDSIEQAIDRSGAKAGNKGADAALAAIELVNLLGQLPQ